MAVCKLGCLHFSFVFKPSVDTVHETSVHEDEEHCV